MKKLLLVCLTVFVLSGCVTTDMTGFIDPKYKNYQISEIVVRVKDAPLSEMLAAEQRLVEEFDVYNVRAIKFSDIAPPTRKYSVAQELKLMRKTGANNLLTIYVATRDTVDSYVPVKYHPGRTTSSVTTIGTISTVNTYTTPGFTTGGHSISSPIMATFSSVIDLRNGNEIWRAEAHSSNGISHSDLLLNTAETAIADMAEKGLFQKK